MCVDLCFQNVMMNLSESRVSDLTKGSCRTNRVEKRALHETNHPV